MTWRLWLWAWTQAIGATAFTVAMAWWINGYFFQGKSILTWDALVVFLPAAGVLGVAAWFSLIAWPRVLRQQVEQGATIAGLSAEQALAAWGQVVAKPRSLAGDGMPGQFRRFGPAATAEELAAVRKLLPAGAVSFFERHSSVDWSVEVNGGEGPKVPSSVASICNIEITSVAAWPEFPALTIVGKAGYRSVVAVDRQTGRGGIYWRPKPGRAPKIASRRVLPEMPSLIHVALLLESTLASSERFERKIASQVKRLEKK